MTQYTLAGLFAGVGGIEIGFEQAGFKALWSNEIDKHAAQTFRANHQHQLVVADINDIDSAEIPSVDILVGGFPCQAFSIAGYRKGFEDERGNVFFQMARIIRDKKPRVIFIENVKNLFTHDKGNTFKVIQETLESYGYHLYSRIYNAANYGNIPQNRERIYIIGFLKEEDLLHYQEPEALPLTRTISDYLQPRKVADEYYYKADKCKFYPQLLESMTSSQTLYQWRRKYVRENKSNLCPTLTANMGTGGHNVPLVLTREGIRKLTPQECFAFQGYPENFILPQELAKSHLYKQAGNSVVVPVIFRIATQIKQALEKSDHKK